MKPLLLLCCLLPWFSLAGAPSETRRPLSDDTLKKLTLLQLRGQKSLQIHLVARAGRNHEVATEVRRLGGEIRFQADDIDYLRALVPNLERENLEALANLPAVEALTISYSGVRPAPFAIHPGTERTPPAFGPEPPLPVTSPYRPITDLDGVEFLRNHPTYDGRGVVIGMLDGLPDLLHPHLSWAKDLSGRSIPKFAEVEYTGSMRDDSPDTGWTPTEPVTAGPDRRLVHGARTLRAPRAGTYRLGFAPIPRMTSWKASAVITSPSGSVATDIPVLWEVATKTVWVDGNADGSFGDERPLQPFCLRGDIGVLGRDDPGTARRESLAFTIGLDAESNAIRLNPGWALHGTAVAGSAAANGFDSGRFDALAGSAQLAAYQCSAYYDAYNVVETLYAAMSNPKVDLCFVEADARQTDGYYLRDGRNAVTIALARIATRFDKLLFMAAGNTSGLGQLDELGIAPNMISVQAYDSAAALLANAAAQVPHADNLHSVGSFGPAGDGALKPDLMAPASHLSIEPVFFTDITMRLPGHWQLPYGMALGGGTSCATPTAAAAAALLISAAKQENIRWNAARLRYALFASARLCDNLPVHQQGRGLIQIGGAWNILKSLPQGDSFSTPIIEVRAPVRTAFSVRLPEPHTGQGIYEREGWTAGAAAERRLMLTRRDGAAGDQKFRVRWRGAREVFTSSESILLPLGVPVEVPIMIRPLKPGIQSGLLELLPEGGDWPVKTIMNTVVVTEPMPRGELHQTLSVDRQTVTALYLNVPPNTSALTLDLSKNTTESVRAMLYPPGYEPGLGRRLTFRDEPARLAVADPTPGVWELLVDNRQLLSDTIMADPPRKPEPREQPLRPAQISLDVAMLRFTTETRRDTDDGSHRRELFFHNQGPPLSGKVMWSALGARTEHRTILSPTRSVSFDVEVPPGARFFRASLDKPTDAPVRVSFSLFRIQQGQALPQERIVQSSGKHVATMERPEPGLWKIVVELLEPTSTPVEISCTVIVAHDKFGSLLSDPVSFHLEANASWAGWARAMPQEVPAAPASLVGIVGLGVAGVAPRPAEPSCIIELIFSID